MSLIEMPRHEVLSDDFEQFAAVVTPKLLRTATALAPDPHVAWDLTQEALFRVWRAWPRVDRAENPDAYATRALIRINLNRIRSAGREARALLRLPIPAPTYVDEDFNAALDPVLRDAIQSLSARQRTAIVCVHILDYSIGETAEAMACRPSTVKTHLARGIRVMRHAWDNREGQRELK